MGPRRLSPWLLAATLSATGSAVQADSFQRIASFSTAANLPAEKSVDTETSAEIIVASDDGQTLVYSDSPLGGIGLVDIRDPANPRARGFYPLGGEPTSVEMSGSAILAAINTSESYTQPSGALVTLDAASGKERSRCALGGQPDSIKVSPDGSFVAVAIENERDEDLNEGVLPQYPAGFVVLLPLQKDAPVCDKLVVVDLTGLAEIAGDDPEPEFVDINTNNEIVVTLQENNHIAVLSKSGEVLSHFSAGSVDLKNVDVAEERALTFDAEQLGRKREPDAVKWLDNNRFVTANEGDYEGGSRGFTIFYKDGKVLYESGLDLEYRIARAGHYPEKRSGNKGAEPEGLEVARFGEQTYMFVLSERGSVVAVYRDTGKAPEFVQLLPAGIAPEGAVALPERGLLATANEKDLVEDGGVRSQIMLYQMTAEAPNYPEIESVMKDGRPIGWGALSGLVADPEKPNILYAISDSFYRSQPSIFVIDTAEQPAKIVDAIRITRDGLPAQKLDLEGITTDGKGGFWLSAEGRTERLTPHALYRVNAKGEIKQEVAFPKALLDVEKRFGAEGITRVGDTLWIAIQRAWKDDPKNTVKLVSYDTKEKTWGAVRYPTEAAEKGWVGLSEITAYGDKMYVIERDNQIADAAKIKRLYSVSMAQMKAAPLGEDLPVVEKALSHDFLPDLKASGGYVLDKIEGFAVTKNGVTYAVTDNDGVDDSNGETRFFSIGELK